MQRSYAKRMITLLLLSAGTFATAEVVEVNEVTVVSQRVERTLTEVPVSISVIDAQGIDDIRAETVGDVIKTMPNVYLQDIPSDYTYFQIRGLPRNLEQSNFPVYVDGVPYTSLYGLNVSLLDVEQIELIRGPQGNLFGANARDGLLSIKTRQPQDTAELRVQLGAGNFDYRNTQLVARGPLVDEQLYASFAAERRVRDGYVENATLDTQLDDVDEISLRTGLTWLASDSFSAHLSLDYQDRDNGAYTYVAGSPHLDRGDDLVTHMDIKNILDQEIKGTSLSLDWDLAPDWTLSSVTGTRELDTFGRFDADLGPTPFGFFDTTLEEEDLFQELRLASKPYSGPVDWLFGLSYFKNEDTNRNVYELMMTEIDANLERDTSSGYANATWYMTPRWTLETGIRYTHEEHTISTRYNNPLMPVPSAITSGEVSDDYSRWLPKAALSYELMQNQVTYLSYGKGMLSGSGTWLKEDTDPTTGARKGIPVIYDPEISSNLELGYKAFWPQNQTSLSLTVFQMDIEDYQHFYPDAMLQTRVASVPRVRSHGVEGSLVTQLTDYLKAMFSFGYSKAEIDEIDSISGASPLTSVQVGDRVPGAPKYNANLQLTHEMPVNENWNMRGTFNASYFGDTIFDNDGQLEQDSYPLIDLNWRLTYQDTWAIRFWAKNITDERYQIYRIKYGTSDVASYGSPRTVGIDLIMEKF